MKFAKLFQQALSNEHIPPEWIDKAIQYKQLKKRINKVVSELEEIGIHRDDISYNDVEYDFQIGDDHRVHPHLRIRISPLIKSIIMDKLDTLHYSYQIEPLSVTEVSSANSAINPFDDTEPYYELKISLLEDAKFFQILYDEIEELNTFQEEQELRISGNVERLANDISSLTIPNMKKSDMYVWREIFQHYIESEIFYSTLERKAGNVDIELSKERLILFCKHINEMHLLDKFKHKESIIAFTAFKNLNFNILQVSTYQSFNTLAVTKILKKFDKQTQLVSKDVFPKILVTSTASTTAAVNILKGSIAQDICFIISNKLLSIVPQIDDYLCPICCSIAFKPIRLGCGHLFCIRCLVKLRRKREDKCPLCRKECLLGLTVDDLDGAMVNYMKTYFPKEVREKTMENDKEIWVEQYGDSKACVLQ